MASKQERKTANRDVLLRFTGEQDVWAFGKVCEAIDDCTTEETGGSREYCVKTDRGSIIICVKGGG